jgi:hypothetical protein
METTHWRRMPRPAADLALAHGHCRYAGITPMPGGVRLQTRTTVRTR